MMELQLLMQRRRRLVNRLGMIVALGLVAAMVTLPRGDAQGGRALPVDPGDLLLLPTVASDDDFALLEAPHHALSHARDER